MLNICEEIRELELLLVLVHNPIGPVSSLSYWVDRFIVGRLNALVRNIDYLICYSSHQGTRMSSLPNSLANLSSNVSTSMVDGDSSRQSDGEASDQGQLHFDRGSSFRYRCGSNSCSG